MCAVGSFLLLSKKSSDQSQDIFHGLSYLPGAKTDK